MIALDSQLAEFVSENMLTMTLALNFLIGLKAAAKKSGNNVDNAIISWLIGILKAMLGAFGGLKKGNNNGKKPD